MTPTDTTINTLACIAYAYAVELNEATIHADHDELEHLSRQITDKLKVNLRAALEGQQAAPAPAPAPAVDAAVIALDSAMEPGMPLAYMRGATAAPAMEAPAAPVLDVSAIARAVSQRVADMDDRSSPEDWPEAMLVTSLELSEIVEGEIAQAMANAVAAPTMPTALHVAASYWQWLEIMGRLTSFSTFVNEFGYEEADCKQVYEQVVLPCFALLAAAPQAPAAPGVPEREQLAEWKGGAGLMWDVHAFGKWLCRVVSPLNWDAHGVYLALVRAGYASHIEVRQLAAPAAPAVDMQYIDHAAAIAAQAAQSAPADLMKP